MKLLKNPCFIMFKLGFVVSLILIVAEKMRFISLEYEIALLTNIIFAVCFGFILYLVAYNVKRNNLIKNGLVFDAIVLGINDTYLGFRIGGFRYFRLNYSYINQNNETVYNISNLIYINRYDFSYIRKLNNYELNRLFRIKIYVVKDDSNKYLAEVYRK